MYLRMQCQRRDKTGVCKKLIILLSMSCLFVCASARGLHFSYGQDMDEEEEYRLACGIYEQGLYELAITRLLSFKDSHPASSRINDVEFLLGECAFQLSRFKQALEHYERVSKKEYEEILCVRTGQIYFYEGEYDRAIQKFQRVISDFPKSKWADTALYFLGESYFKKGDCLSAIDVYKVFLREYPDSSYLDQCYYSLAYCYYKKNDFVNAILNLDKVLKDFPSSSIIPEVKILKGQILAETGDYAGALEAYKKVLSELSSGESGRDFVLFQAGTAYFNLNNYTDAETSFQILVSEYPRSKFVPWARKGIADCLYKRGDFQQALQTYKKLLADFPGHEIVPELKYWIANTLWKTGNIEDAISGFRNFIDEYRGKGIRDELVLDSWIQIGEILYAKGDFSGARDAFAEAISAPARFGNLRRYAIIRTADCFLAEKKYERAVEYYRRAQEETAGESEQIRVKFQIAYSYYKQNDFGRAIPLFQDILLKESSIPAEKREDIISNTLYWLGWAYFKQGKFKEASEAYKKLVEKYPSSNWYIDALYRLGDSLYNMGSYAQARKAYEQVFSSGNLEPESLYAIACSYYLEGKTEDAMKTYRVVFEKYPQHELAIESAFKIAEFENQSGRVEEAISFYRFIIANSGGGSICARAQMGIGDALFKSGKYREAITAYRELTEKYPAEERLKIESEFKIGNCYFQLGENAKALEAYLAFIQKYQSSDFISEVNYRVGFIYFNDNKFEKALPYFQKSASLSSRSSEMGAISQVRVGDCLFNLGKYEDATAEYVKVLVLYPAATRFHPESQYKIGVSLLMSGKIKEAKESFQRVIEKYPASTWAKDAKEELNKLQQ